MSQASRIELRSRVPQHAHGLPLVDYLAGRFPYLDRAGWASEIAAGRLRLDGRRATAAQTVRRGAELVYERVQPEPDVDTNVRVLHADAHLVVVDKPAHLPAHADGPFVRHTLVHIARTLWPGSPIELVHRLDRETSGVCVLARTPEAREALRRQFADRTVDKSYLAVVAGRATGDFAIDRPIGRCAGSAVAIRRSAGADALDPRPATTRVTVLRASTSRSLLHCRPLTGRTHQIRVHLEAVGLPVLGDKLYGRPDAHYLDFVRRMKAGGSPADVPIGEPSRHLLHASELSLVHPGSGERMSWRAETPPDFERWLDEPGTAPTLP